MTIQGNAVKCEMVLSGLCLFYERQRIVLPYLASGFWPYATWLESPLSARNEQSSESNGLTSQIARGSLDFANPFAHWQATPVPPLVSSPEIA